MCSSQTLRPFTGRGRPDLDDVRDQVVLCNRACRPRNRVRVDHVAEFPGSVEILEPLCLEASPTTHSCGLGDKRVSRLIHDRALRRRDPALARVRRKILALGVRHPSRVFSSAILAMLPP